MELAVAFGSLCPRGFLGLFCALSRLLGMLGGPLRLIRLSSSIVYSGPLDTGGLLGVFCAFCRLLGVLRPLFAHGVSSFFPLKTSGSLHCFFCCTRPERMTQSSAPR